MWSCSTSAMISWQMTCRIIWGESQHGEFLSENDPSICAKWGWNIYDWNPSMTRVLNGKQTMWSLNSRVLSVVSITEPLLHRGPTWKNWFQPSLFQSICASVPWFGSKLPVANTSGNDRLLVRCRELEALGFSMEKHEAFRSPAGSESLMVPSPSRPSRTASGSLLESTPRPTELFLGTFLPPRRRRDSPKTSPRVTHLRNRNNSQGGTQKRRIHRKGPVLTAVLTKKLKGQKRV